MTVNRRKGKFITVEGIDGAGKTAVISAALSTIKAFGYDVIRTREPGGTKLGETLRSIFLSKEMEISAEAEVLIVFAARFQHIQELIIPTLNSGGWVLCDRFTDATYAYQGGGRGVGFEKVKIIEEWVQDKFRPDLTFFLDASIETAELRSKGRGESGSDRIEIEKRDFHATVRNAYLSLLSADSDRIKRIDGEQSKERVVQDARELIEDYLRHLDD